MLAHPSCDIAELSGEKEPWQQLALCYLEHVDTKGLSQNYVDACDVGRGFHRKRGFRIGNKLRNETNVEKAPFKRATSDEMTLCSWIQAIEWAGVLLREMEERLPEDEPVKSVSKR